ncbi:MAG: Na(+)-translocating NADH-quinone reductase subunit A [Pseudomonadota bacterium]
MQPPGENRSAGSGQGGLSFKIKRGLDLPITGAPEQQIEDGPAVASCALVGADHLDLKAKLLVAEGERVRLGQPLFADRRFDGVLYTAPGGGTVRAINRGQRRVLQSVVIDLDETDDPVEFPQHDADALVALEPGQIRENILIAGLWPSIKTRPYSKVPDPQTTPAAIFVTAMDSGPLAPDAAVVIGEAPEDFANGVRLLAKLTEGTLYVCARGGSDVPQVTGGNIKTASFEGPHPSGLAGTHIHMLDPVHAEKTVWHINYQDVIAIGELFRSGRLPIGRVISLAGPAAQRPRLLRTRVGAGISGLLDGEVSGDQVRVISGNVLTGRIASGPFDFLGRFHHQISLLPEGGQRELFGWLIPSMHKFATANVHLSSFFREKLKFSFNTSMNGSARALIPVGLYEDVMPLDILATQLLRAILILDTEDAQSLGCLELDEDDLALCSYICMSKYEYGMALRANLEKIEAEG